MDCGTIPGGVRKLRPPELKSFKSVLFSRNVHRQQPERSEIFIFSRSWSLVFSRQSNSEEVKTPKTQRPKSQPMIAQNSKTFILKKKGFNEAREVRQHKRVLREIRGNERKIFLLNCFRNNCLHAGKGVESFTMSLCLSEFYGNAMLIGNSHLRKLYGATCLSSLVWRCRTCLSN